MDELEKRDLLSMALELSLLGEQVELARLGVRKLIESGHALSSPEVLKANEHFNLYCNQFLALEKEYIALRVKTDRQSSHRSPQKDPEENSLSQPVDVPHFIS